MPDDAFDWPQFLILAEELASRPEEACLRTAISRAYYFAYHLARTRILENGFTIVRGGDTHKQVWEKFDAEPDFLCKKLAQAGKRLNDKRRQADYDLPFSKIEREFPEIINIAKRFSDDLGRLDSRLPVNRGIRT